MKKHTNYTALATAIRILAVDALSIPKSGHLGMVLGCADVVSVLFAEFLRFNPQAPKWPNRDRFILSAGHGSILLYTLLYLTGYTDITLDDLKNFRQLHAKTAGHPEYNHLAGIETTTGPLGQGVANGVGMAMAAKILKKQYHHIIDNKVYVLAGDGCLMEGVAQEAISLAGHLGLENLIVLFDDNKVTIDGGIDLSSSEDHLMRFRAANWEVHSIDGHNYEEIYDSLNKAQTATKPTLIACKTIIGYKTSLQGTAKIHGGALSEKEAENYKEKLGYDQTKSFDIPAKVLEAWRAIGTQHTALYQKWQDEFENLPNKAELSRRLEGELPEDFAQIFTHIKIDNTSISTREASALTLAALVPHMPELIGGSADLSQSNSTKTKFSQSISASNFSGNYIHYGIREHGMGAIMNGISLNGGFIPYGGTFLVFSDYARAAIRLSALMQQPVIYVMTHDSIGLGEDGPTHQPVEHLSSLRAMPNLLVFRPADLIETIECWQLALINKTTPSILALSRQDLPLLRLRGEANLSQKGAYILKEATNAFRVSIFATGSELHLAYEAAIALEAKGIGVRVISMVCFSLFEQQSKSYQDALLGNSSLKVAVEAAVRHGWDRYITRDGIFIGMSSFGTCGKYQELYQHFGISVPQIIKTIMEKL